MVLHRYLLAYNGSYSPTQVVLPTPKKGRLIKPSTKLNARASIVSKNSNDKC